MQERPFGSFDHRYTVVPADIDGCLLQLRSSLVLPWGCGSPSLPDGTPPHMSCLHVFSGFIEILRVHVWATSTDKELHGQTSKITLTPQKTEKAQIYDHISRVMDTQPLTLTMNPGSNLSSSAAIGA
jgi:hypothetical protein